MPSDSDHIEELDGLRQQFVDSMPDVPPVNIEQLLSTSWSRSVPDKKDARKSRNDLAFRMVTLASLAGIIAMLAFGITQPARGEPFRFEEVKKNIEKIRSVQFTTIRTEPRYMAGIRYAKDSKQADDKFTNGLKEPQYTETMILGKYLRRYRHLANPNSYYVDNLETGRSISVDEDKKTYTVLGEHRTINMKGQTIASEKSKPAPEADFYRRIKEVPVDELTAIGEAYVDGRKALGFRRTEKLNLETWTQTYWIDAKTQLPVRQETSLRSNNPMIGENDWVRTNFVFDAPLEETMFDTSPEGYQQTAAEEVLGIDPYGKPAKKN